MVSTEDSDSSNPGSSPGKTFFTYLRKIAIKNLFMTVLAFTNIFLFVYFIDSHEKSSTFGR